MRLPTVDEAKGIGQRNKDDCAFPCDWGTWTSTGSFAGTVFYAFSTQDPNSSATSGGSLGVLCVSDE